MLKIFFASIISKTCSSIEESTVISHTVSVFDKLLNLFFDIFRSGPPDALSKFLT